MMNKWEMLKETLQEHKTWNKSYYDRTGYEGAKSAAEEDEALLYLMERLEEHEKFMKKLEAEG